MKIGLLVNDHVADRFRHISGDYTDMFQRLLGSDDVEIVAYDVVAGELPASPEECDAWVATGSRHSVNDDEPWIHRLEGFVRRVAESHVPYVGICFGHQMLAKALGGTVEKSERGWGVGVQEVETAADLGLGSGYRVLASHQDQVVEVPPGAEVLGWSEHCPVSMFTIDGTMMGIQGHPEFEPEYSEALMRERRGRAIPEEVADAGIASLSTTPDNDRLADWILGFIRTARFV